MNIQSYPKSLYQFVQDHLHEDPALLLLKHPKSLDFDVKIAARQIAARQKAKAKLPTFTAHPKVIFPGSLSVEQSSSEQAAEFKAKYVGGEILVDLTGGLGVDVFFMGRKFKEAIYVEKQEELVKIAAHNFMQLSEKKDTYKFIHSDSMDFLEKTNQHFDWLYIDPARRGAYDQKLYKLADCDPDVIEHWGLIKEKAKQVMIKASPMLDIKESLNELPDVRQVVVVAIKNEVKEVLLVWEKSDHKEKVKISAFDLNISQESGFDFTLEEEANNQVSYSLPQEHLIEPNAAILKAGAFKSFANRFGLSKLHPNTHLYTSSTVPGAIPGRIFSINREVKLDKKELRQLFPSGKVNVIVRNHALKADALKKKYGLKDGGRDFLIATRTMDEKSRVYWCRRSK